MMVPGVKAMTRDAGLYGHLTKQEGTPRTHFYQFISCFINTLWKSRNLPMYRHTNLLLENYVRMGLSYLYCQKSVEQKMIGKRWWTSFGREETGSTKECQRGVQEG